MSGPLYYVFVQGPFGAYWLVAGDPPDYDGAVGDYIELFACHPPR